MRRKIYKKYHKKNLKKYDKNKDSLITLKEYLAEEISRGPHAEKTDIDYNYQSYMNIYNYFLVALINFRKFKILCIPNFILKWGNYATRAAVVYVKQTKQLYIANNIIKSIKKCSNQDKVRFIYFSFILLPSFKEKLSHSNIVVIDLVRKTVELFEPYGYFDDKISKYIENTLFKKILKILELNKFKYLPPSHISPKMGIQKTTDAYCGMCITISMMYLHMRILNPDINQKKIIKHFLSYSKNKLKDIILKYARHVEDTLKKNKFSVVSFNEEYIRKVDQMFNEY